jgi:hypothetical protein
MTHVKQEFTRFYYNEKTKTKQYYDKKTYTKLVLNRLKIMEILLLFIPIGHLVQRIFSRNFQPICSLYSPMCAHVYPCVNYKRTKIQLKMN